MTWAKSARCESSGCVEVDVVPGHDEVGMRNSTQPDTAIEFPAEKWLAVLGDLKDLTTNWSAK